VKIKIWHIQAISYLLLLLPTSFFIIGWIRPLIAIPAVALLLTAWIFILLHARKTQTAVFEIKIKTIIFISVILLLWCYMAGQGGFFYQSSDHHYRNAIFRDLIAFRWPVIYEQTGTSLVYYIGFWLIPASIGKVANLFFSFQTAWIVANAALFLWSFIYLFFVSLLILIYTKADSFRKVVLAMIVFVCFSGMDIIGTLLTVNFNLGALPNHLEWWAQTYQYSSNTTQLFWVYNQSTPAWLATALFVNENSVRNYVFLCLIILICSSFPAVGLLILLFGMGVYKLIPFIRSKQVTVFLKDAFSVQNIVAAIVILPIIYLYFHTNQAVDGNAFQFNLHADSSGWGITIIKYLFFCLLEFGFLSIVLFKENRNDILYWITVVSLLFEGAFSLGVTVDFAMRASIPALLVLMMLTIRTLNNSIHITTVEGKQKFRIRKLGIAIAILLIIGTATPLTECRRAVSAVLEYHQLNLVADDVKTLSDKPPKDVSYFLAINYKDSNFYKYLQKQS
jgi:hypothetical protein